jgi:hypothetical protein
MTGTCEAHDAPGGNIRYVDAEAHKGKPGNRFNRNLSIVLDR